MSQNALIRERSRAFPPVLWLILSCALILVDRISKALVYKQMYLDEDIPILGKYLHFYYLSNKGAAFSLLQDYDWGRILFIVLTVLFIIVCIWALVSGHISWRAGRIALAFVIGGGIGNLIDRIFYGEVIDFIYIAILHFAVFNLADAFVVIGVCLFCLSYLLKGQRSSTV
ncbi:MAG TPA: signal peptidase II [Ruminococcaceae bacterium]|nr:signal peptidase II [Oscillospiraceae bacterium]